jgi:hypothetical protein
MINNNDIANNNEGHDDTFVEDTIAFWERCDKRERALKRIPFLSTELKESIVALWWKYFDDASPEEALQNYLNCKYQFELKPCVWLLEEMMCFSAYIEKYEKQMPEMCLQLEEEQMGCDQVDCEEDDDKFPLTYDGLMKWNQKEEKEEEKDANRNAIF